MGIKSDWADGLLNRITNLLVESFGPEPSPEVTASLEQDKIAAREEFADAPRMLAWYLDTAGRIQAHLGDLTRSEELLSEAHRLRLENFGEDHYLVGLSLQSLATLERARGDEEAAVALETEARRTEVVAVLGQRVPSNRRGATVRGTPRPASIERIHVETWTLSGGDKAAELPRLCPGATGRA